MEARPGKRGWRQCKGPDCRLKINLLVGTIAKWLIIGMATSAKRYFGSTAYVKNIPIDILYYEITADSK